MGETEQVVVTIFEVVAIICVVILAAWLTAKLENGSGDSTKQSIVMTTTQA